MLAYKPICHQLRSLLDKQGLHFALIQPSDLILVDHDGNVLDESGPNKLLNKAAFMIHSAIHRARPNVLCAAHSHSIHGRAFSTLGKELDIITQDSCAFYKVGAVDYYSEACPNVSWYRIMPCTRSSKVLSWIPRRGSISLRRWVPRRFVDQAIFD
jgi:hypothetical protein